MAMKTVSRRSDDPAPPGQPEPIHRPPPAAILVALADHARDNTMFFHRSIPSATPASGFAAPLFTSHDRDRRTAAADCPISQADHPAIVGYFSDRHSPLQLEWIEDLIPGCVTGPISESYIAPIAGREFRIFAVCGNDPSRMIKLLRAYHNHVGRKLNIALLHRSTPTDRARLLTAGYDDVFDLRTTRAEALSRLHAHLRRMDLTGPAPAAAPCDTAALDRALEREPILTRPCTERERLILAALYDRRNAVTPNHVIHRKIRSRYGHSNIASLHVVICHIRKKLAAGYAITYSPAGGYMLTDPDHAGAGPGRTPHPRPPHPRSARRLVASQAA